MTRTSVQAAALAAFMAMLAPCVSRAQDQTKACEQELIAKGVPKAKATAEPCFQLAVSLVDKVRTPLVLQAMLRRVPPRELQSRAAGDAGTAGSPSQGEAVPSVQPLALAGGSLAAVGSGGGTDAIAAFAINPAMLFGVQDKLRAAALSRLLDLSILVPINDLDRDEDGAVDYYGIRARLNITGPRIATKLAKVARTFALEAQKTAEVSDALSGILAGAPDFEGCLAALRAEPMDPSRVSETCGKPVDFGLDSKVIENFRQALSEARDSADAQYLGLDLRLDQGDPTLGATPDAAGTALFAGVAFGRKVVATDQTRPSFGLKARLGVQHVSLDQVSGGESDRTNTSIDGALAFDLTYPHEFLPLVLAAGLEFRAGDPPASGTAEQFRTNFLQARLSLDVPITAANTISIAFAGPLTGDERPTLSVNANWQLLLPGAGSGGGTAGSD